MATPGPRSLTPEIEHFRKQFEQLSIAADALVAPLGDAAFAWQPAPDRWSVAQCLDHLNATARVYLPVMDEGIADAIRRSLYAPGPFKYNLVGRVHVLLMHSTWVRARTSVAMYPAPNRPRHDIMAAFRAYQVQYIDRLRQASGLDLARAHVSSPLIRWLPMPLGSAFAMMIAHEQRHLLQAQRLIEMPGFPKS
jgi:hypothetical protein